MADMPSPPRHFLHAAHESRQIQYRELPKAMQVGAIQSDIANLRNFLHLQIQPADLTGKAL